MRIRTSVRQAWLIALGFLAAAAETGCYAPPSENAAQQFRLLMADFATMRAEQLSCLDLQGRAREEALEDMQLQRWLANRLAQEKRVRAALVAVTRGVLTERRDDAERSLPILEICIIAETQAQSTLTRGELEQLIRDVLGERDYPVRAVFGPGQLGDLWDVIVWVEQPSRADSNEDAVKDAN